MNNKIIKTNTLIIGGGASGLTAYYYLKEKNIDCKIIEISNDLVRKVSATGNGRCNLTNKNLSLDNYYPINNRFFVNEIINIFDNNDTLDFMHKLGIECKCTDDGLYYPVNERAEDVSFALASQVDLNDIYFSTTILDINYNDKFFTINTNDKKIICSNLVVSSGLNASDFSYDNLIAKDIAKKFDIKFNKTTPALVPLETDEKNILKIDGIRQNIKASLYINNTMCFEQSGQVQFTKKYLSGIVIFNISNIASTALRKNDTVEVVIDFLPSIEDKDLYRYISDKYNKFINFTSRNIFTSLINKKISNWICDKYKINPDEKLKNIDLDLIYRIAKNLKEYKFNIINTAPYNRAQTSLGGIDVEEIISSKMSCKKNHSLYFIGECVDITGECGGYNLQFAWSSGYICANDIKNNIK